MCDMTHSHSSPKGATFHKERIQLCDVTHACNMNHSYVCHDSRSSPKESTSHEQKSCARCFLCCFLLPVSSYSSPMLQRVVVRCGVLQCVAVRCSALQCFTKVLRCVAVCCCFWLPVSSYSSHIPQRIMYCIVLQSVAVCYAGVAR